MFKDVCYCHYLYSLFWPAQQFTVHAKLWLKVGKPCLTPDSNCTMSEQRSMTSHIINGILYYLIDAIMCEKNVTELPKWFFSKIRLDHIPKNLQNLYFHYNLTIMNTISVLCLLNYQSQSRTGLACLLKNTVFFSWNELYPAGIQTIYATTKHD